MFKPNESGSGKNVLNNEILYFLNKFFWLDSRRKSNSQFAISKIESHQNFNFFLRYFNGLQRNYVAGLPKTLNKIFFMIQFEKLRSSEICTLITSFLSYFYFVAYQTRKLISRRRRKKYFKTLIIFISPVLKSTEALSCIMKKSSIY